jgi:hypothetical protein
MDRLSANECAIRVGVTFRRLLTLLLVGLMTALAPLAQASPPDQTWLAGLYDNADYDDVVLSITSAVSVIESPISPDIGRGQIVVAFVSTGDESLLSTALLSSNATRAPPAA